MSYERLEAKMAFNRRRMEAYDGPRVPSLRERVYNAVEYAQDNNSIYQRGLIALILINICGLILRSFPQVQNSGLDPFLERLEDVATLMFAADLILRFWSCTVKYPSRLAYLKRPWTILDLVTTVPGFMFMFGLGRFQAVGPLRVLRIIRVGKYFKPVQMIARVVARKRYELVSTVGLALLFILTAATAMFFVERQAQPEAFGHLGDALWWAVVTLTTVGYGDAYPITGIGRVLAGFVSLLGIGVVAVPTAILAASFMEEMNSTPRACEHCGKECGS